MSQHNRRLASAAAGVTTAALLLGSGTLAVWNDVVLLEGGEITAGNLDVETIGDMTWSEASPDRTAKIIDLNAYRIVPGDTIRGSQDVDVALQGNNLKAKLSLKTDEVTAGGLLSQNEGVTLTYTVVDKNGEELISATPINEESIVLNLNATDGYSATTDGSKDFTVSVEATFDKNTPNQVRVREQAELAALRVSLQQVRGETDAPDLALGLNRSMTISDDKKTVGKVDYGDKITVTYRVTNRGFTTAKNVTITDPFLTANNATLSPSTPVDLAPNKTVTFTAIITADADIVENGFNSTPTATGVGVASETLTSGSLPVSPVVNSGTIAISSEFVSDDYTANVADPGDTIKYTVTVKNTGSEPVEAPTVTDAYLNSKSVNFTSTDSGVLAVGASRVFTATFSPSVNDLAAGSITVSPSTVLTTTACGSGTCTTTVTGNSVTLSTTPVTTGLGLTGGVIISNDAGTVGQVDPGESLSLSYTVKNNSSVRVTNISTNVPGVTLSPATVPSLNPGESAIFTGSYSPTNNQITGNGISFNATTTGSVSPGGTVTQTTSNTVSTITPAPVVEATATYVLSTDNGQAGKADANDVISFTRTVKNTGNVTLNNITPSSNKTITWSPANKTTLAVGETVTFTGSYTVVPVDVTGSDLSITHATNYTSPVSVSGVSVNLSANSTTNTPTYKAQANLDGAWNLLNTTTPGATGNSGASSVSDQNGNIYVIGGNSQLNRVDKYNPVTNSWSSIPSTIYARYAHSSVIDAQGRIYAIGGSYSLNMVERYDPATNQWTTLAPMNTGRYSLSSVIDAQGRIYAIGGYNGSTLKSVERYDPATNQWTTLTPMNTARYGHSSVIDAQGRIYAIGGYNGGALNSVERYDPVTNQWTTLASMNTGRYRHSSVIDAQGYIYAIGGYNSAALNSVERYDPVANQWATQPSMILPVTSYTHTSHVDALGRIYVIGGLQNGNWSNVVRRYTPGVGWSTINTMNCTRYTHTSAMDPQGRIYALGGGYTNNQTPERLG